jgi:hypothetical protein
VCCSHQPTREPQRTPPILPERWTPVADLGEHGWLVADKRPDSRSYFIKRDQDVKVIIGAAEKPVLHHIGAGKLYFTCWGRGDSLFVDFPVMRVYDLQGETLETQQLFFGPGGPVAFGDPTRTPGNQVRRIDFIADGLEVGFTTAPGAGPEAYAGAGLTIPWTQIDFEQGSLVLSFRATTLAPQLQVSPPPSLSLIEDIRVTRYETLDLVRVALKVPPFTVYRASCGTGERTRVLSLYLQCRLQTRLGGPREG